MFDTAKALNSNSMQRDPSADSAEAAQPNPQGLAERPYFLRVFLLALALRLVYAFLESIPPAVDARAYDRIAHNLLRGCGFRLNCDTPIPLDTAILRPTILYPFFLTTTYSIFGDHLWAVWTVQALLGAATCVFLGLLGRKAFDDGVGRLGALLAAVAFDLIIFPGMLLTETLYLFLATLSLLLLFQAASRGSEKRSFLSGVCVGLTILTRPVALGFLFLFIVWRGRMQLLRVVVPVLLGTTLVVAPWSVRNLLVYDEILLLSAGGGLNLWVGNHPGSPGEPLHPPEVEQYIQDKTLQKIQVDREGYRRGVTFIRQSPVEFLKLVGKRFLRTWSLIRTNGFYFHMRGLDQMISVLLSATTTGFLLAFGLLGFVLAPRRGNLYREGLILYGLTAMVPLILFYVTARHRLPVYPTLIIYAAAGLDRFWQALRNPADVSQRRRILSVLAWCVLGIIAATVFDSVDKLPEIQQRLIRLFG
jgi:4-amino-4-deoxy-L-arabinose transferase-like glycosyltransferase